MLRNIMIFVGAFVVTFGLLMLVFAALVRSEEYRAVEPFACAPSAESWWRTHGRKVVDGYGRALSYHANAPVLWTGLVRWDSGVLNHVTIAPARDPDSGEPALCVVAVRYIEKE